MTQSLLRSATPQFGRLLTIQLKQDRVEIRRWVH